MRFSERSRICLIPRYFPRLRRSRRKSVLFLSEKGPGEKTNPKNLDVRLRHICSCPPRKSHAIFGGDRLGKKILPINGSTKTALGIRENGSPPIPGPLRFQRNLRGRPFFRFACFSPSHRWLGKKNLRHAPANPFMRFARRAVNRKERQDFIPSAPQGQRKKTRESEETLLCRRKSLAIFDGRGRVPRKFIEFSGDNEKKSKIFFPA